MKSFLFVAALGLGLCASPAMAQANRGSSENPVSQAIREAWDGAKKNIRESADVMSEAEYLFKPVDSVRSFGAILAHLTGPPDDVFCSAAKGERRPRTRKTISRRS